MSDYDILEDYGIDSEERRIKRLKTAMRPTAAAMLDADDERFLKWLAGWDRQTVEAAAKLFAVIEYCGANPDAKKDALYIF